MSYGMIETRLLELGYTSNDIKRMTYESAVKIVNDNAAYVDPEIAGTYPPMINFSRTQS